MKLIVTKEEKEYLESLVDFEERKTSYGTDKYDFLIKLQKKFKGKDIRKVCKYVVEMDDDFLGHKECSLGLDLYEYGSCNNCKKYEPIPDTEKVNFT